jgi:hypothetical protein
MLTKTSIAEKKLIEAMLAYLALKISVIVLSSLAALVVLLYLLSVLLNALVEVCTEIATTYGQCSPIEKLLVFVLAWALLAWAIHLKRSLRHGI